MTTCHVEGQYGTKIGYDSIKKHIAMERAAKPQLHIQ